MTQQPEITQDRLAKFEAKTAPISECGCVFWVGGTNEHGYGVFWNGVRLEKAHRFALRAAGVEVPADADVCHTCDIPCCVAPAHLLVGNAQLNVDDMWAKSRATVQIRRGTAQTQAKLNDFTADLLRAEYATGRWKQRDIAEVFGVSQTVVWKVVNNLTWTEPSGLLIERGRGK